MTALHQRLRFDTDGGRILDADRRYLLLRADVLRGLFDALPEPAREEARRAFARSVATHGADSVRAYAEAVGVAALPGMMEDAAASLGWGRWHLQPASAGDAAATLALAVENSPFAAPPAPDATASASASAPTCHAIAGMLEALAGALWHEPAEARETRCAAVDGGSRCEFVARRAPARSVAPDRPLAPSP